MVRELLRNDQIRVVLKGRSEICRWIGRGVRAKERSQGSPRILACATGSMVVPFTNMGGNQEEQISVRIGRSEHGLEILNCPLDLKY